jgi:glycosyltransferase involved in cell wall biosynthesis
VAGTERKRNFVHINQKRGDMPMRFVRLAPLSLVLLAGCVPMAAPGAPVTTSNLVSSTGAVIGTVRVFSEPQTRLDHLLPHAIVLNEGELAEQLRRMAVPTFVLPESRLAFWSLCRAGRDLVRTLQPNIVHTHRVKEDVLGAVATLDRRSLRRVRTVHGVDEAMTAPASVRRRLARRMHQLCVGRMFHLTCAVSRPLAERLAGEYGVDKVSYVPNGLDLDSIKPSQRDEAQPSSPLVVGFVGRLVPVKRVDLFLGMAAALEQRAPGRFEFRIIGEGPQRAELESLGRRLGIAHAVHFKGFAPAAIEEIAALNLLYLTSDSEGLPMVLLEAMALGVPVVAHAVGEIPEVLDGGRCGTLVERHTSEGYAEPALHFLAGGQELRERAQAAQRRVREHYSAEHCARAYLEKYRQLLSGPLH